MTWNIKFKFMRSTITGFFSVYEKCNQRFRSLSYLPRFCGYVFDNIANGNLVCKIFNCNSLFGEMISFSSFQHFIHFALAIKVKVAFYSRKYPFFTIRRKKLIHNQQWTKHTIWLHAIKSSILHTCKCQSEWY